MAYWFYKRIIIFFSTRICICQSGMEVEKVMLHPPFYYLSWNFACDCEHLSHVFSIVRMHHHALWMLHMINKQYTSRDSVNHVQVVPLLYPEREVTWQKAATQSPPEEAGMRGPNGKGFLRHFQASELRMMLKAFHLGWCFLSSETRTMPQSSGLTWSVCLRVLPSVVTVWYLLPQINHCDRGAMNLAVAEWKDYLQQCRYSVTQESKVFWDGSFSLYWCSSCHHEGERLLTFTQCGSYSAKSKTSTLATVGAVEWMRRRKGKETLPTELVIKRRCAGSCLMPARLNVKGLRSSGCSQCCDSRFGKKIFFSNLSCWIFSTLPKWCALHEGRVETLQQETEALILPTPTNSCLALDYKHSSHKHVNHRVVFFNP